VLEERYGVKKFFLMMGLWAVAIVTIIVGSGVYTRFQSSDYDDVAGPYIKKALPEISTWDPDKTRALMTPEISAGIPEQDFTKAMAWFSRLGALQSMDEPDFIKAYLGQDTSIGKLNLLEYEVDAKYANGDAVINLKLIDKGGAFEIYRFNFSSETLIEQ
jgi:hypothetical protein